MALSFKNMFLVLMALLCFFVLLLASGCIVGHESSYRDMAVTGVQTRRELRGVDEKKKVVYGVKIGSGSVKSELRKAPSGPDPIHHNAAHPKNPTSISPPTRH